VSISGVSTAQTPYLKDLAFKERGKYYAIDSSGKTYFSGYDESSPFKHVSPFGTSFGTSFAAQVLIDSGSEMTISESGQIPLEENFYLKIRYIDPDKGIVSLELRKKGMAQSVYSQDVSLSGTKPIDKTFYYVYPLVRFPPRPDPFETHVGIAVHLKEAIKGSTGKKKITVDGIWQISMNKVNRCGLLNCDDGNPCTDDSCVSGNCKNTQKNCNDNLPCTTDTCGSDGKCTHGYSQNNCADGKVCCYGSCLDKNSNCDCGGCDNFCPTCSSCENGKCTTPKPGKTITVGIDAVSIQDAVNKAVDCDTIIVPAGTYNELVLISKSITIIGKGNEATIIDGTGLLPIKGSMSTVFWIEDPENRKVNVALSGLKLKNASLGIFSTGATLNLIDCNVTNNGKGGIWCQPNGYSIPKVNLTDSYIHHNGFDTLNGGSGGAYNGKGLLTVNRTSITDNKGSGIANIDGRLILKDCTISGNDATGSYGGGIVQWCGNTTLINTIITTNIASNGGGVYLGNAGSACSTKLYGDISQVKGNIGGDIKPCDSIIKI
jgi:hypothetical protein